MKKVGTLVVGAVLVLAVVVMIVFNQSKETEEGSQEGAENAQSVEEQEKLQVKEGSDVETMATKTDRPRVSSPSIRVIGADGDEEEGREMLSRLQDSMVKQNEAKAARLIAKLVEDLNLTPEQKKGLEDYFAKQIELAGGFFSGGQDGSDPMAAAKAMAALKGLGLDEVMEGVLTPEQAELWTEREEKRVYREADSAALKELSKIGSVLDVREDQRDAVYEHFYQKQLNAETDESDQGMLGAALGGLTEGLGVEMDTNSLFGSGFQEAATAAAADGGEVDIQALMRQQREKQIDAEVQELDAILDESQLEDYRSHLQSQGTLLNGLMGTIGTSSTQVIPVVPQEE